MSKVSEYFIKSLQDHQDHSVVQASIWTFRTIGDLRSVFAKSQVLKTSDRVKILFRGFLAIAAWLPVNLVAIPYVFAMGARKNQKFQQLHAITQGLYLGTEQAARSFSLLKKEGITCVLSILDAPVEVPKDQIKNHLWLVMEDSPEVDIRPIAEKALSFVREARQQNQKVLVHCKMGMSRSASVMVSLVQKLLGMKPKEALAYVSQMRPVIDLNFGFKKQILRSI